MNDEDFYWYNKKTLAFCFKQLGAACDTLNEYDVDKHKVTLDANDIYYVLRSMRITQNQLASVIDSLDRTYENHD